jgi:hypothetical protein
MAHGEVLESAAEYTRRVEKSRVEFLLQRDGAAVTVVWVRRTLAIYRRAVLDRRHFAHTSQYRLEFIVSCLEFRRWLIANDNYGSRSAPTPAAPR